MLLNYSVYKKPRQRKKSQVADGPPPGSPEVSLVWLSGNFLQWFIRAMLFKSFVGIYSSAEFEELHPHNIRDCEEDEMLSV